MVWQTYDYYLEPTAAYYGVKHACEPLHVQWNPLTNQVEVINHSAGHQIGKVTATIYSIDGILLWSKEMPYDLQEDHTFEAMTVEVPHEIEGVYFLRLSLTDTEGDLMSQNDYIQSHGTNDRKQLRTMPESALSSTVNVKDSHALITLTNCSSTPAVMLRLNLKGSDGEQILPVIYSDNYLHLMPGESRTIDIEWKAEDTRGTMPMIEITGTNVTKKTVRL